MPSIENTPQRVPEITREFQLLEERMERFETALNVLGDRLTPALSSPSPTTDAGLDDAKISTRMAMRLRDFSNTVARWQMGVEDVCQRLEF
jgi:hypothetical protein